VLLEWLGDLFGARPADARDIALPEKLVDAGIDVAELGARADAAVSAFRGALQQLDRALRAARPTERSLRNALVRASAAGAQHAVPRAILPVAQTADLAAAQLAHLQELATAVHGRMLTTGASLDALDQSMDLATADADDLVEHHVARIRAVFGNDFPVLPRFTVAAAAELDASLAEQGALAAGDPLAPMHWLQRMALVRPDADRLQRVLTAAELLNVSLPPADFRIAQLPHLPGQRWAALPQPLGASVDADLALALHAPGTLDLASPLAGLVCDDWAETIPDAEQVTACSTTTRPVSRAEHGTARVAPTLRRCRAWTNGGRGSHSRASLVGPCQLMRPSCSHHPRLENSGTIKRS
jgi:hypothetical protein